MVRFASVFAVAVLAGGAISAQAGVFTDTFNPPSALWSNSVGGWTSNASGYFATVPNNNPFTYTALPFQLTDFSLSVGVSNLTDGGIFLHSDGTNNNGILLILGGAGYGNGTRGGNAGTALYWHIVQNGVVSSPQDEVDGVFVPGNNYTIQVSVVGNTYSAFVNGSATPTTTLTTSLFPSGEVGLYDNQPNTITQSGSGPNEFFTSFSLTAANVPEPASLGILGVGLLAIGRRRARA